MSSMMQLRSQWSKRIGCLLIAVVDLFVLFIILVLASGGVVHM
jgi:hypothetical protein